jgi:hypothetical protein
MSDTWEIVPLRAVAPIRIGLLKSHGLTVSPEDRPKIVEAAERRQQDGLRTWILRNL